MLERNGNMDFKKKSNYTLIGKEIEINNVESSKKNIKIDNDRKINEDDEARLIFHKIVQSPEFFDRISNLNYVEARKEYEALFGERFREFPNLLQDALVFLHLPGDNGRSIATKPDWFDKEKFVKGQAFALENAVGFLLGQLFGLLCLICQEDGLKTLTMTKKSHTPYLAFDRYLSTLERVLSWYKEDPWKDGTKANRNIHAVRRMHSATRKKLCELDHDQIEKIGTLKDPYCPVFPLMRNDFSKLDCLNRVETAAYTEFMTSPYRPKGLNQVEMSYTLFGFMGMIVLYPQEFGVYPKSDEDLENFCHVWRTIGYLLGVEDEVNLCRGSLEDIKKRCQEYLEFLVKPVFQRINPQYEHMSRCILEGFGYYFPHLSFKLTILRIAELMNIEMPELYGSLTYTEWFQYLFSKYFIRWGLKYQVIRYFVNKMLYNIIERSMHLSNDQLEEFKERSRNSKLHVE